MEYRILGSSGLRVSCLALGGNIFGCFCDARETATLLATARDVGVNLIDTAGVYSDGLSEEFIGAAIRNHRGDWILASKVGVCSLEYPGKKGRRENILKQVEASLRRLKTDYIDIYQMHHYDPETPLEETLSALDEVVRQGKVRYTGISNYSPEQLKRAWHTAKKLHVPPFSSTQNHYNLFKRQIEADLFPMCRERGLGVLIFGALARGVLTGKYRSGQHWPPASRASLSSSIREDLTESVLHSVAALAALAAKRGKSVSTLALAWVLRCPEVSAVICGIRNPEQMKENLGYIGWRLSQSDLAEIDAIVGDLDTYRLVSLGSSAAQPGARTANTEIHT